MKYQVFYGYVPPAPALSSSRPLPKQPDGEAQPAAAAARGGGSCQAAERSLKALAI